MKNKKTYIAFLIIAVAFFAGRYSTQYEKNIHPGTIKIDQTLCDWAIGYEVDEKPASFTLFIRNSTDKKIKGSPSFILKLDGKGFDENYIKALMKLTGKDQFTKEDQAHPKTVAISEYIKRGMKLKDGYNYEPITPPVPISYISSVSVPIELNPNEATQITLNFIMPPTLKGYLFEINQK